MEQQDTATVSEAQAIEQAQAGYAGKTRAQAPVEPAKEQTQQSLAEPTPPTSEEEVEDEPAAQAAPTPEAVLKQQLEDIKAQVRELAGRNADADTVRKMHGEIGDINRTLKQIQAATAKPEPEKVDELAAALEMAEKSAKEFPEIAGPLLATIKVMQSRMAQPAEAQAPAQPTPEAQVRQVPEAPKPQHTPEEIAAIKALDEVHPDRHQVKESAEFKQWFATKSPEYQKKATTSWNPAVVAQPFTDFKAFQAARKRKQERLDAAVTPQGTSHSAQPNTLPDEAGFERGYAKVKRLRQ